MTFEVSKKKDDHVRPLLHPKSTRIYGSISNNQRRKMNFENAIADAINPLHRVMLIASILKSLMEKEHGTGNGPLSEMSLPYLNKAKFSKFPKNEEGATCYPSKELAGVAGLYTTLLNQGIIVIFANDLSLEIHGIDAIAFDPYSEKYILCEAKGTSSKKNREYGYYLRNTKHKGRQLSREWCWASIVEYAFQGPTAPTFLRMLEPILDSNYERLLCVTTLRRFPEGFATQESKIWKEEDMSNSLWFSAEYDFSRQQKWYHELKDNRSLF